MMKKMAFSVLIIAICTLVLALGSRYTGTIFPLVKNGVAPSTLLEVTDTLLLLAIALALLRSS